MTNQEKARLLTKANEYIKKCNAFPVVHAFEGGVLELNSLLVDFVKHIGYENGKSVAFQYAESNGLLSSKHDIDDFNKWIMDKYNKSCGNIT